MKKSLVLIATLFTLGVVSPIIGASSLPTDPAEIVKLRETQAEENETIELFSGEWVAGEDFNPGRYKITCAEGQSGNFYLYDSESEDFPFINLILSTREGFGVPEVNVDIAEGQKLALKGIDNVKLEPVETKEVTELTSGIWVVGADVKPGKYIATTEENTSGNLFVYDSVEIEGNFPSTNEILGQGENNTGVEKVQLKLEEGQTIIIQGISKLYLE